MANLIRRNINLFQNCWKAGHQVLQTALNLTIEFLFNRYLVPPSLQPPTLESLLDFNLIVDVGYDFNNSLAILAAIGYEVSSNLAFAISMSSRAMNATHAEFLAIAFSLASRANLIDRSDFHGWNEYKLDTESLNAPYTVPNRYSNLAKPYKTCKL